MNVNAAVCILKKIDTVIIRVRRLEQAQAWYAKKLGLNAVYEDQNERLVVFSLDGETSLTIYELKPGEMFPTEGTARSFPIFSAGDIHEAHKLLSARGVEVGSIEGEAGGTEWFMLKDCDGNTLEVCHYQ